MNPHLDRAQTALEVLRQWNTTSVNASVNDAVRSYHLVAEAIESDPLLLSDVDVSVRYALLLDLAEVGASQIARLAREATDGTATSRAGRQLQEAFGRILRAAGCELSDLSKREAR